MQVCKAAREMLVVAVAGPMRLSAVGILDTPGQQRVTNAVDRIISRETARPSL